MTAEEFIKENIHTGSNAKYYHNHKFTQGTYNAMEDFGIEVTHYEWLTPFQALAAVELKKEEVIEKAISWLEDNVFSPEQLDRNYSNNFRKAMEE